MPGLIRGVARTAVIAGTASTVAGRVNHRQQEKWSAQDQQAQAEQQAAQPQYAPPPPPQYAPPPEPVEDETTAQLKKLAELHNQGVLTDEEFSAAKAKALGI